MKSNKLTRLTVKIINGTTWARFSRSQYGRIRKLDDHRASMLDSALNRMLMLGQIRVSSMDMQESGSMSLIFVFPEPNYVPVTKLYREDIAQMGFDPSILTHGQLVDFAYRLEEYFVDEEEFLDHVSYLAEHEYNLPRLPRNNINREEGKNDYIGWDEGDDLWGSF
jgi:hypothetical protein